MGATTFQTYALGKTPREAFSAARERAGWDHGHSGYSGSIYEKPGFVLFTLPKGVRCTATKFIGLLDEAYDYDQSGEDEWQRDQLKWCKTAAERRKLEARFRKDKRRADAWWKKLNPALADVVRKATPVYQQKWDECIAVEMTGAEATKIKENFGRKGTHDKVFVFAGYASC